MRAFATALPSCALAGTVCGAAYGLLNRPEAWPGLGYLATARAAAVGWLAGIIISVPLALILAWRFSPPTGQGATPRRRFALVLVSVASLAPGLLWLNLALPRGAILRAAQVGRPIWDARPNMILITIDALRPDHLGAYGSTAGLTPNLDAFAREATRYDAAYASAPWTLPSFGAILASRPPSECGLKAPTPEGADWYTHRARLPDSVPLLPEQLHRVGYATAAELTNPFLAQQRGWNRGLDDFRNEDLPDTAVLLTSNSARADTVTNNARLWLKTSPREPFFLWVHYLDPHAPYDSPDTPAELRATYPADWETGRNWWLEHMPDLSEEEESRYADFRRTMYAEEVRYADRWVGDLLEELKARGRYRRSLIVITSDHGEELFEHGGIDHGHSLHEEVLWVPLLVKWPEGWQADRHVRSIVALTDLAPTFLQLAGAPPMEGARGVALPVRDQGSSRTVYSEAILHGAEQTALTTERYKIIHRPSDGSSAPEFAVYDRRRDRLEQHDLGHHTAVSELQDQLYARTEAAQIAAAEWHSDMQARSDQLELDERAKQQLEAVGYLGR